ncbi:hypothetical protein IAI10_15445 [Clostridium sp. 19966]|uniref:hypothetical protein n=1 Tax=Clostridium sp. 19966 TaxID=2768166 RepID=UPI0028DF3277|nr:hypothetical protein [Clostridium sp. 19966]MDT8718060.1 hypothetical protein [Clostridium sp. 19966]
MEKHQKIIICGLLSLMSLVFITEGKSNQIQRQTTTSSGLTQQMTGSTVAMSESELKSIENVSLSDDSPASIWWIPKDEKTTINEITAWLQQAKPYKGEIPKDQINAIFNANIAPSTLYITTSDKHEIKIQPACVVQGIAKAQCVTDVLEINKDKQKSYIQCSQLFNWLKNDKWNTEFEKKQ